jgi:hypothetical protein
MSTTPLVRNRLLAKYSPTSFTTRVEPAFPKVSIGSSPTAVVIAITLAALELAFMMLKVDSFNCSKIYHNK